MALVLLGGYLHASPARAEEPEPTVPADRPMLVQLWQQGGAQVRAMAAIALTGTDDQVREYLGGGFEQAQQVDLRDTVAATIVDGGPAVRGAAQRALADADAGNTHALAMFLDAETTTLTGLIEQAKAAEEVVERETANAKEQGKRAADGAAAARRSAQEAAQAVSDARENAAEATSHAKRAAVAARKAAQAAQVAVDAAAAANRAARKASIAAARASRAASMAAGASSAAYVAAANAALDRNTAANARVVAEQAKSTAKSAEDLAAKAGAAGEALEATMFAIDAATDAAAQATAAAVANELAVQYANQAGAHAQDAVEAARVARANAERATRAANSARRYLQIAITSAYASRDAANAAAADARRAAAAAIDASEHAVDATEAAVKSTEYANAATVAANKVVGLADQALTVFNAARDAESERLAVATDEASELARQANAKYEAQLRQADWDTEQAAQRDAETNRLIAEALSPVTDRAVAVTAARKAAVALAGAPGVWTRQGAVHALGGSEDEVLEFLRTGLAKAAAEDNRIAVMDVATSENAALAGAAQQALAGTDAAVAQFLKTQNYSGRFSQDRVRVNQILAAAKTAGRTVTVQRAQAALDAETLQALRDFLGTGQYTASAIDDRVQANQFIADPENGPELKAAAQVALEGPALGLPEFLKTGRYTAAERDNDTAVHVAVVGGLLEKINELASTAVKRAQEAQSTAARARGDGTKAQAGGGPTA